MHYAIAHYQFVLGFLLNCKNESIIFNHIKHNANKNFYNNLKSTLFNFTMKIGKPLRSMMLIMANLPQLKAKMNPKKVYFVIDDCCSNLVKS